MTGVNFAIAETGTVVVVTNEGNSDLGVHLGKVQIHSMGIEKLIPKWQDLGIFTRLRARSATGQPISISLFVDGRAILHGIDEAERARALYARYIGS